MDVAGARAKAVADELDQLKSDDARCAERLADVNRKMEKVHYFIIDQHRIVCVACILAVFVFIYYILSF